MMEPRDGLPDGVFAASLTPQTEDLRVDPAALVAHVQWLLANGCDGVLLFGTTGEATSFSLVERMDALDAVVEAGVPPRRLLVGTGCCAVPDTVALTRHAVQRGAGGVLLLPPFYYKNVSDDGLFAAFDQVIQQVGEDGLGLYLYHFPKMSGVPIPSVVVERLLARYPNTVTGMKDSSGDWAHMRSVAEAFPGVRLYAGTERYLLDVLGVGGAGCITATTNVTCRLAAEVYARRDEDGARAVQRRLTAVRAAIEAYPVIPALKRLMAEWSGQSAWRTLRPPLAPLPDNQAAALLAELARLEFSLTIV